MKELKDLKIVFFGTGPLAESALVTLCSGGLIPKYLVTKEKSPSGRGKILQDPDIKHVAEALGIKVLQPTSLKNNPPVEITNLDEEFDLFIVASYGKIITEEIISTPLFGTLNIHPSLLPKYRGPTPIETALLNNDKDFGVSVMFLDGEVDHGPILAQKIFNDFVELPTATTIVFEKLAGIYGASMLLTEVLMPFVRGAIVATEQDHSEATFTSKLSKDSGLITLDENPESILSKYRACTPWPSCHFYIKSNDKNIRVKVTEMVVEDEIPQISKVIPEGKKEMSFESFRNGYLKKGQ